MTQLTLERTTPSGHMWTETFDIVETGKYGFSVKKCKGEKVYTAIRNQQEPNWITVLNGKGRKVFQGMIVS